MKFLECALIVGPFMLSLPVALFSGPAAADAAEPLDAFACRPQVASCSFEEVPANAHAPFDRLSAPVGGTWWIASGPSDASGCLNLETVTFTDEADVEVLLETSAVGVELENGGGALAVRVPDELPPASSVTAHLRDDCEVRDVDVTLTVSADPIEERAPITFDETSADTFVDGRAPTTCAGECRGPDFREEEPCEVALGKGTGSLVYVGGPAVLVVEVESSTDPTVSLVPPFHVDKADVPTVVSFDVAGCMGEGLTVRVQATDEDTLDVLASTELRGTIAVAEPLVALPTCDELCEGCSCSSTTTRLFPLSSMLVAYLVVVIARFRR